MLSIFLVYWGERERAPSCGLNGRAVMHDRYITAVTRWTKSHLGARNYWRLRGASNILYYLLLYVRKKTLVFSTFYPVRITKNGKIVIFR